MPATKKQSKQYNESGLVSKKAKAAKKAIATWIVKE